MARIAANVTELIGPALAMLKLCSNNPSRPVQTTMDPHQTHHVSCCKHRKQIIRSLLISIPGAVLGLSHFQSVMNPIPDGQRGRIRAVVGIGSLGRITCARSRSCGKSIELSVTIKSALPVSAQVQNGSSSGSGEISLPAVAGISSAWERIKLMATPMKWGRTPRRARISLYSSTISSLISQTKVSLSIQSRKN